MDENIIPIFRAHEGDAYHGTRPEYADCIVTENHLKPSTHDRNWYGSGCYLYEHGAYRGWESAEHFMRVIMKSSDCAVVKVAFSSKKCLDLNIHANFEFLTRRLFPALVKKAQEVAPNKVPDVRLQDVLRLWLQQDTDIDAVRGTSFEGDEFIGTSRKDGKFYPGNILLDVQMILCIRKQDCIKSLTLYVPVGHSTVSWEG